MGEKVTPVGAGASRNTASAENPTSLIRSFDSTQATRIRVIGIDPGLGGAAALLVDGVIAHVADLPVAEMRGKRRIDPAQLVDLIESWRPDHAIVELVGARPGQGVVSMFGFGRSAGVILGILAGLRIPTTEVAPVKWKRLLGVPAGKDAARARAGQLLPTAAHHWPLKRHDGRAEACRLALFGSQLIGGQR
jgi:crossover junction endodeoxyribonuclease RuvC